jgi:hypothetical protein
VRLFVATLFAVLALASPAYATSVTNVTVDNTKPTSAAGARTGYVVTLTLTSGISNALQSRINVTFPAGTTFEGRTGGETVVDLTTGQDVGFCTGPSGLTIQCQLDSGASIPAGRRVQITSNGVTNPSTPRTDYTVGVTTTVDADLATSAP